MILIYKNELNTTTFDYYTNINSLKTSDSVYYMLQYTDNNTNVVKYAIIESPTITINYSKLRFNIVNVGTENPLNGIIRLSTDTTYDYVLYDIEIKTLNPEYALEPLQTGLLKYIDNTNTDITENYSLDTDGVTYKYTD